MNTIIYVDGRCITCAEFEIYCVCELECDHINVNDNLIDTCANCGLVDEREE